MATLQQGCQNVAKFVVDNWSFKRQVANQLQLMVGLFETGCGLVASLLRQKTGPDWTFKYYIYT